MNIAINEKKKKKFFKIKIRNYIYYRPDDT